MEVKRLPEDNWIELRTLRLEGLREEPIAFSTSHGEEADFPERVWRERMHNAIFAVANGMAVGVISVMPGPKAKNLHVAQIHGMYVSKGLRGKGIGEMLLRQAISEIRSWDGIRKIDLGVIADQEAAIGLYRKCGFNLAGRLSGELQFNGDFYDELLMELIL